MTHVPRRLLILALLLCAPPAFGESYYVVTAKTDVSVTGTATLVAAQNDFRIAFSCTNNDPSVAVRWGDSTVTATKGQRFPAGTSIEIRARGAIYMISEDTAVPVSCTEEAK